jgi:hypothetical protein
MKRALLIGIDYVSNPSIKLNGCVYDVINMSNILMDAYDYSSSNITILRDDINNSATMPTRANIINNLLSLAKQSGPLDEIWIHYSGHGSQITDKTFSEQDGLDEILVPVDYQTAGFIKDNELLEIIKTFPCKTLLLFDACHSGTMCDLQWSFQYVNPKTWTKIKNNNIVINNPNIYMISGCKDDQTSADTFVRANKISEGAFTNAFINALRYYRHNVSINTLYQYVCSYLTANGFKQLPVLSTTTQNPNYNFTRALSLSSPASVTSTATLTTAMKSVMIVK